MVSLAGNCYAHDSFSFHQHHYFARIEVAVLYLLGIRAFGLADGAEKSADAVEVEAVDDRPHVLLQSGRYLTVANLTVNVTSAAQSVRDSIIGAVYYEITISGAGLGAECSAGADGGYAIFAAKYLVTPVFVAKRHRLHVKRLASDLADTGDDLARDGVLGDTIDHEASTLTIQLLQCAHDGRELVVDIRRVGRRATLPSVRVY